MWSFSVFSRFISYKLLPLCLTLIVGKSCLYFSQSPQLCSSESLYFHASILFCFCCWSECCRRRYCESKLYSDKKHKSSVCAADFGYTNVCMSSFYYTVIIKSLHNNNRLGVRLLLLYCTTCSCQVSAGYCVRE